MVLIDVLCIFLGEDGMCPFFIIFPGVCWCMQQHPNVLIQPIPVAFFSKWVNFPKPLVLSSFSHIFPIRLAINWLWFHGNSLDFWTSRWLFLARPWLGEAMWWPVVASWLSRHRHGTRPTNTTKTNQRFKNTLQVVVVCWVVCHQKTIHWNLSASLNLDPTYPPASQT